MCPVYLRYFTFLPVARIDEIIERHQADPSTHLMQRTLAGEVTRMVHGPEKALRAETQSSVLYDEDVTAVPLNRILAAFEGDQRLASIDRGQALGSDVWKVALAVGLVPSKSEWR